MFKVIVSGRATHEIETKNIKGAEVVNLTIATKQEKGRGTNFIRCSAWGTLATNISKYVVKGQYLVVIGTADISKYTGSDGIERDCLNVTVTDVEFGVKPKKQDIEDHELFENGII